MLYSCDSKAKIHVGSQAMSRYHQVRNFFPAADTKLYGDHDFPIPNYLIEPDSYLLLQSKMKDKLGRSVTDVPATGPMWIYNRCGKNKSTTFEIYWHSRAEKAGPVHRWGTRLDAKVEHQPIFNGYFVARLILKL